MPEQLKPVPIENRRIIIANNILLTAFIIFAGHQLKNNFQTLNKTQQLNTGTIEYTPASSPPTQEQYCIMVLNPNTTKPFLDCSPIPSITKPIFET